MAFWCGLRAVWGNLECTRASGAALGLVWGQSGVVWGSLGTVLT